MGAAHQINWKKVGLSRAYFKQTLVVEENMPTVRSKAAFRYIRDNNGFYANFLKQQHNVLSTAGATNISSYDLFIVHHGIECAMFPHLYPEARFTDTGIMQHYLEEFQDNTNRVVSIGYFSLCCAGGQFFETRTSTSSQSHITGQLRKLVLCDLFDSGRG